MHKHVSKWVSGIVYAFACCRYCQLQHVISQISKTSNLPKKRHMAKVGSSTKPYIFLKIHNKILVYQKVRFKQSHTYRTWVDILLSFPVPYCLYSGLVQLMMVHIGFLTTTTPLHKVSCYCCFFFFLISSGIPKSKGFTLATES